VSKERELLQRVRDVLRGLKETHYDLYWDIQTALAQPEQEPVGYLYKQMDCHGEWGTIFKVDKPYISYHDIKDIVPVYTAPQKSYPLSDEWIKNNIHFIHQYVSFTELVRGIEKAHGIGVDDEH
jgi:hypothetical protein